MEVGKAYYVVAHAYWHYVGIVSEVTGPKSVKMRNVCQVHSCGRNWTRFFAEGFGNDTKYDVIPDGINITAIISVPWDEANHIPMERKG